MKIRPIRNERDYETALSRIEEVFDAAPGTPKADELDVLGILVHDYEERHYPIPLPNPIEAIKFRMEQQELRPKDLVPYIGSASKVSEVLSGKRALSLAMIRKLSAGLDISAEVLVQAPKAKAKKSSKAKVASSKETRRGTRAVPSPR